MAQPLAPLPANEFGYEEAAHLLRRAGFGGTPSQIVALSDMGLDDAVDHLVVWERVADPASPADGYSSDIMQPLAPADRQRVQRARRQGDEATLEIFRNARQERQRADRRQMREIQAWWLERLIETARPLQEKMTLFWHGHFATGYRSVEDSWHMLLQNEFFRRHAGGNFKDDLVHGIIRDPAMIKYLNNNQNTREAPNENLARELMELFTLGEGNGYTENDIKEGARALTGMTYRDDQFAFNQRNFDSSGKRLFGRSGQFDADDFVELIFQRPSAAWFTPWKLHRFFVDDSMRTDGDIKRAVDRMSRTFRRSNWEIRPVLRELFRSAWFYAPENRRTLIKSPVQLAVEAIRSFGTPARSIGRINQACGVMGQELFQPPSVKGWEGGRKWINTSTLFVRENLLVYLLTGRDPAAKAWESGETVWSAEPLIAHLRSLPGRDEAADIVMYLSRLTLGEPPTDGRVEQWTSLLRGRDTIDNTALVHLLSLMTASPEYQLS
ncbi:MAG: DUF1800 domain-containing protein [Phycisphaerales bacterium]|jgi:hypothetical protein|nr:DUF1800 domain-containing protein [Phycisphaerales bacterium]